MTVELRIAGSVFEGFQSGSVQLTLEEVTSSFDLEYIASGREPGERVIYPGDACELAIDGDMVIGGHIDDTTEDDGADEMRLGAVGRSKAADLTDCSSIQTPGHWEGATLDRIITDLCEPFGISAYVEEPGERFASFHVQKGETVLDTILRGTQKRGLLLYSVGADVVAARAGHRRTATVLERGVNVLRWGRTDSWSNRFSQYVFQGQAKPTDATWGAKSQQLEHIITDPGVRRFRPLRVVAEAHSGIDLKTRATLERNQRAGRSERITVLVEGFANAEGVWRPNTLVHCRNRVLGLDATLLVVTARFRFGAEAAEETELLLARPQAYDLAKYPALGRGDTWT